MVQSFFLHFNAEMFVQLAMMADAGDEGIAILRKADSEDLDMSTMPDEIAAFLGRVSYLFKEDGCLHVQGYTQVALASVKLPLTIVLKGGKLVKFGHRDGLSYSAAGILASQARSRYVCRPALFCDMLVPLLPTNPHR